MYTTTLDLTLHPIFRLFDGLFTDEKDADDVGEKLKEAIDAEVDARVKEDLENIEVKPGE